MPHVDELLAPPVSSPLPSRAPATPTAPDFDASTPWTPAPAPTGFPTFAPTQQVPLPQVPAQEAPSPIPFQAELPTAVLAPSPAQAPSPSTLPAWQRRDVPAEPAPAFGAVVGQPAASVDTPKRKWGLFGRKKDAQSDAPPSRPIPPTGPDGVSADLVGQDLSRPQTPGVFQPVGQTPESQAPVRASAFGATSQAHVAPPQQGPVSAWPSGARPGAVPSGAPAMFTPPPITPVYTPQISHEAPTSWSPPVPAASGPAAPAAPAFGDLRPVRNGALDDEVAAMLALRSDIQEQALSELSQLSAYRPTTLSNGTSGTGSLTRRVPTAIPKSPEIAKPDGDRAVNRDAAQLRSRLSSFQSGTSRGRRAMDAPTGSPALDASLSETSPAQGTQDSVIDDDHDNTPSTPSW
ncbi:hypothetical protein GALL_381210 [mine drainage metagenome]|uniref:Uncharacterized protein n=1 Tax=mine drainage metagenome TaxID=410659 RepID=A0A1J5QJG6_9ZZZZ